MSKVKAFIKQFIPPIFFSIRDHYTKTWDLEYNPDGKIPISGTYNSSDIAEQQEKIYRRQLRKGFDYSSYAHLSQHNQFVTLQLILATVSLDRGGWQTKNSRLRWFLGN